MKSSAACLLALMALMSFKATAQYSESSYQPWTFRFDVGGNIPESPSLTLYDGPVTAGDSMDLSAGGQLDFALGYRAVPWLIFEGEFGFSYNDINSIGNWTYRDSSLSQLTMMANVVIEPWHGPFVPYAGVGAGGVFSSVSFGNYSWYYYDSYDGYGTDFVPAVQAIAGLRYKLTETMSLGLTYRFLAVDRQKWDVDWWNGADFTVGVKSMTRHFIGLVFSCDF